MPCWVAPIVAAELWGVTPGHVLGAIADGSLPSREEYGFVLVDVAPDGACPAPRAPQGPPPPTYTVVSHDDAPPQAVDFAEVPALAHEAPPDPLPLPEPQPLWAPPPLPVADEAEDGEIPPLDEEEDDEPISHWRQVRSNMGRMRKPPAPRPPTTLAA